MLNTISHQKYWTLSVAMCVEERKKANKYVRGVTVNQVRDWTNANDRTGYDRGAVYRRLEKLVQKGHLEKWWSCGSNVYKVADRAKERWEEVALRCR